jgi:transcription antitermination factor NusA-like protein
MTKLRNESFDDTVNNLKHSVSESDLKVNDDNNDDDDVWCNQEDEDNLEHCVKLDQERIERLREILGNEKLQIIFEVCQVRNSFFTKYFIVYQYISQ